MVQVVATVAHIENLLDTSHFTWPTYLVTYSEDDKTIVEWKFDENGNFKPDHTTKADHDVHHLRVSRVSTDMPGTT